jgi:hypothetical protein
MYSCCAWPTRTQIKERAAQALAHWSGGVLSRAFNQWVGYYQGRLQETRADVHYYGRLLDEAWLTWREVSGCWGCNIKRLRRVVMNARQGHWEVQWEQPGGQVSIYLLAVVLHCLGVLEFGPTTMCRGKNGSWHMCAARLKASHVETQISPIVPASCLLTPSMLRTRL